MFASGHAFSHNVPKAPSPSLPTQRKNARTRSACTATAVRAAFLPFRFPYFLTPPQPVKKTKHVSTERTFLSFAARYNICVGEHSRARRCTRLVIVAGRYVAGGQSAKLVVEYFNLGGCFTSSEFVSKGKQQRDILQTNLGNGPLSSAYAEWCGFLNQSASITRMRLLGRVL